ncbi:MAG: prepilin-type N-terminal cleavage/methylation domain-containing protein [Vicinamibacterales bacterium]
MSLRKEDAARDPTIEVGTVRRVHGPDGFSLVELVVAAGVAAVLLSAVVAVLGSANAAVQMQPEAADVEQRLRAASDSLHRDLLAAGGGAAFGPLAGPMGRFAAAVLPWRVGRRLADPPGRVDSQRVTIVSIDPWGPQSVLAAPLAADSGSAVIQLGPWCPDGDPSCGFRRGMTVVIYDVHGAWSLFAVTAVAAETVVLEHQLQDWEWVFGSGTSVIAEATVRAYQLSVDSGGAPQLVRYDGGSGADVPVASDVTGLSFEYSGEAEPPAVLADAGAAVSPIRTTYGPPPPEIGSQPTNYPPGENCAFRRAADGGVASRLDALGDGAVLVPLAASQLSDGPWCPDERSPNRYDADLLRVRLITVAVRVEAAPAGLRGTDPALFSRPGPGSGPRLVPDRQVIVSVAPRALNFSR